MMAEDHVHRRFRTISGKEERHILLEVELGCLRTVLAFTSSSSWISTGAGMKTVGGATASSTTRAHRLTGRLCLDYPTLPLGEADAGPHTSGRLQPHRSLPPAF